MAHSKEKPVAPERTSGPVPAVSGARELRPLSRRPTVPVVMTYPPESQDRLAIVDDEDEIPEILREPKPRARPPSKRPPPAGVARITPAKMHRAFGEEVVVNRKDPRRED